jgi:hypothetical protein
MGLAAVCGLMFGAAALTNSVLLPFGVVCSGVLLWKKLAPRTLCAAIAIASLALPCAWGVRNLQLADTATTSVASDRALQNLVQGSWPEYHSAWRAGIGGGTEGKATLEGIDQEYRRIKTSFPDGASAIMQRLAEHPLDAMAWYLLRKPCLLWDWDIRIGQGDIYVFPTNNSPFQTNPFLRLWASICRGFNPLLALFALGSIWFLHQGTNGESAIPGARCGLVVTIVLLAYVTVVYSVLQAEPRYSIPFRPLEILLAVAALHAATALSRKRIARVGDSESGR